MLHMIFVGSQFWLRLKCRQSSQSNTSYANIMLRGIANDRFNCRRICKRPIYCVVLLSKFANIRQYLIAYWVIYWQAIKHSGLIQVHLDWWWLSKKNNRQNQQTRNEGQEKGRKPVHVHTDPLQQTSAASLRVIASSAVCLSVLQLLQQNFYFILLLFF